MTLYRVNVGDTPLASDIDQFVDAATGINDIGQITLAAQVAAPTAAPNGTAVAGSGLGVGSYMYVVTFLTGYKKSNGTIIPGGETLPSPALTVTTTSGSQQVNLSNIPTSTSNTVIGRRIYRTQVGGSTYYKLTDIYDNSTTTYTDTTADASLITSVTPPSTNTTGTYFSTVYVGPDQRGQLFANGNTMVHMQNLTGSIFNEAKLANYVTANAFYDGTNWNRFDTTQGASAIVVSNNGQPQFRSIGSGSNPITWNTYNIFHEGNFTTRTHVLAYLGSATQSLVSNSWNRVKYDTIVYDYLGEFSTSNWYFTALNTGIYAVSFGVRITNCDTENSNIMLGTNQLNRAGNYYNVYEDHVNAATVQYFATQILYLSAGTQLECRVWLDSGTTTPTLATGQSNTWLNISRIA